MSASRIGDLAPPLRFPTMGRYELRRELGRGAASVVYEAFDTKDHALVALKTLAADEATLAEHLYRLKQEFRALADLEHPNIVRFGELASHEGQWFFTLELVRGASFVEYVRATSDDEAWAFDEGRLRSALAQLVSALAAIHGAGRVHRDVKPSNVLVTPEGRVVVLDFGLMTPRAEIGADDGMHGTPDFMAPEQIHGERVGPAADGYAVGTMLFQALTGRLPFTGRGAMDLFTKKITRAAPAPHDVAAAIPPDLDALCSALLESAPERRPSSAEILAALGSSLAVSGAFNVPDLAQTFVGRDEELAVLERTFDVVAAGGSATVVVLGEPGIGKSALVHRFLGRLDRRALVVMGRSYEQESVPFKGIDAIIDSLSQHLLRLRDAEVRELLAGGVRFLAAVFPVLNRVPLVAEATLNARTIENPMALREQAFGEFERLLAALTRDRRVVLFLDDFQWADRDSLALLNRALHPRERPSCLLVTTIRTGAPLPPGASELLAGATRIPLGGLTDSESKRLCANLGGADRAGSSPSAADALVREASGHPLYLAELVQAAQRGGRAGDRAAKLQEVLWERIQERDPLERRFLEMVAVAGVPTPYEVLAEAAGLDVGACQTRLGALRASQLVRLSRRGEERLVVAFHDRVRESILQHRAAADESHSSDHLRLGRALLARTPADALSGRIFAVVRHLNAGRLLVESPAERLRFAELNLVAAREAILATTYEAASGYAEVGLALLGPTRWEGAYATTRELQLARMRAEFLAGDTERARGSFEEARAHVTSHVERTDLYVTWIELESHRGAFEAALDAGRARLRELGVTLPRRITFLAVLFQFLATRLAQSGRPPDELRALPELTDGPRASAMRVLWAVTPAAYWISSDLVGWIALKLARMSMRYGLSDVSSYGFATYGVVLEGAFGKNAEAADFGRLALRLNEQYRNERLSAQLHLIHGEFLAPWVQPIAAANEYLRASYESAVKNGDTTYEAYAACSLSHLGAIESRDLDEHQRTSEWARGVCARRKDWNMVGSVLSHLRFFAVLRGDAPPELSAEMTVAPELLAIVGDVARAPSAHDAYWEFRGWAAYLFGENRVAALCLRATVPLAQAHFGHLSTLDLCFLDCLVTARAHDTASWGARVGLALRLAWGVRRLRAWAAACPANFEPHYLIARAELARVRRAGDVRRRFDEAVASARAHRATLREGLALELAALNAGRAGDAAAEETLRGEAIDAYRRCGARAKAEALARR